MPPPKKQNHNHGLGKALMNHRAKTKRQDYERELHTTEIYDNKPISVTQESDLENFLNTAAMAGVDFTAVRQNVVIIPPADGSGSNGRRNPFLLSPADQAKIQATHRAHKDLLRVPRRPQWTESTTAAQLDRLERDAFLEWRKGLADLSDNRSLLLTPFERNIQVWRQLWRVIERSQLVVQIVDARNPLRFRCEDLEKYVDELSNQELAILPAQGDSRITQQKKHKTNLLLVNKADLLTETQRLRWADYFESQGIQHAFFSASNAAALQAQQGSEGNDCEDDADSWEDEGDDASDLSPPDVRLEETNSSSKSPFSQSTLEEEVDKNLESNRRNHLLVNGDHPNPTPPGLQSKTKILTVAELENLFLSHAEIHLISPTAQTNTSDEAEGSSRKLIVGLVGYPNVGKSSTINALVGAKKVSVSATPGKTKHFQTIHLSPDVILCDCPGLVFPQFASTKAELVCDGVLPIDQMREHTGPISLITQRIPKAILEATYGLQLPTLSSEEGGDGSVTASEFLTTYAIARGAFTGGGGMGRPDESKVARPILKDYVSAKLLYCEPPPLPGLDPDEFNRETREMKLKAHSQKKLAPTTRVPHDSDTFIKGAVVTQAGNQQSSRSQALDQNFMIEKEEINQKTSLSSSSGNLIKVGIKGRRLLPDGETLEPGDLSKLRLNSDRNLYSIDHHGNPVQNPINNPDHNQSNKSNQQAKNLSKKHFKRSVNPGVKKGKKMRSGKGYDDF